MPLASWWRWRPLACPSADTTVSRGSAARSPTVRTASRSSRRWVAGPTPQSASTGSGWRKASSSPGRITVTPGPGVEPRRCRPGAWPPATPSLARNLLAATPTEQARPWSLEHVGPDGVRDLHRRAVQPAGAGHVEERLVEGQRLDQRRVGAEHVHHAPADLAVVAVVAREEHRVRGRAAAPAPRAWPSGRRAHGPRTRRRPRRRGCRCRRRPPAGPAARGGAAARRTRRTRPCRRGGSSGRPPPPSPTFDVEAVAVGAGRRGSGRSRHPSQRPVSQSVSGSPPNGGRRPAGRRSRRRA